MVTCSCFVTTVTCRPPSLFDPLGNAAALNTHSGMSGSQGLDGLHDQCHLPSGMLSPAHHQNGCARAPNADHCGVHPARPVGGGAVGCSLIELWTVECGHWVSASKSHCLTCTRPLVRDYPVSNPALAKPSHLAVNKEPRGNHGNEAVASYWALGNVNGLRLRLLLLFDPTLRRLSSTDQLLLKRSH